MQPNINSIMAAGFVIISGMMIGQVLSGITPFNAVKYQIIIFLLITSGTFIGSVAPVIFVYFRIFNNYHQFNYELIENR